MRRDQRLRASGEFLRVRNEGRAWAHPLMVLCAAPGRAPAGQTRVGVSVGRRIGGAVVRNRVRRRIGESVRLRYDSIAPGWDLVFVARAPSASATFDAITGVVGALLQRSGLLKAET